MIVDTSQANPALLDLYERPDQTIFLDANILISPDRSAFVNVKPFLFSDYKKAILDPLLSEFSNMAIHESVYEELVGISVREYVEEAIKAEPPRLAVHWDRDLNMAEQALMATYIGKLAPHSQYDPAYDNAKDRGEIKSLSYMATKSYLYFAANDALPIRLVKDAERLQTGIGDLGIIQMYELIYYLYSMRKYDTKQLRIMYKYLYYLTGREKNENPDWSSFTTQMDCLYKRV